MEYYEKDKRSFNLQGLLDSCSLYCGEYLIRQKKYPTKDIEPYYDVNFTQAERDSLFKGLEDYQKSFQAIHQYTLSNNTPMSLVFDPIPMGMQPDVSQKPIDWGLPKNVAVPANRDELAFYPVYKLVLS